MKEKRLKDGKRDRRWGTGTVKRLEEARGEVVVSRVQAESKEARYMIRRGSTCYALFDPEECLHVGRHDGAVGIVYRFKHRRVWQPGQDQRDCNPAPERGLVPWEGGGWEGLAKAAAAFALGRSGQQAPDAILEAMAKPGAWGRPEFWKDMADKHALALKIGLIKEVMES